MTDALQTIEILSWIQSTFLHGLVKMMGVLRSPRGQLWRRAHIWCAKKTQIPSLPSTQYNIQYHVFTENVHFMQALIKGYFERRKLQ